jgi:hypothetical protein
MVEIISRDVNLLKKILARFTSQMQNRNGRLGKTEK